MTLHPGLVGVTCESNDYTHTQVMTGATLRALLSGTFLQRDVVNRCLEFGQSCGAYIDIYTHTYTHTYASKPKRDIKNQTV